MPKGPNVDRRGFVRLLLAGGAGSLAACAPVPPDQKIVSPVDRPEEMIPGKLLDYATTCRACPAGCGMTVRTREARATKLEGLAGHPVNDGALCARGQAQLQQLYSPDRLTEPLRRNDAGELVPIGWDEALALIAERVGGLTATRSGSRLAVLSRQLGPTMRHLLGAFVDSTGGSLLEFEPFPYAPMRAASELCFGKPALWRPHLERARMVLSLGADFLETWLSPVHQSRGYTHARRYEDGAIGTHYQVEPRLSLTGANADQWILIRPGTEHILAMGLLRVILAERLDRELDESAREALTRLAEPYLLATVEAHTEIPIAEISHLARTFATTRPAVALPPGLSASGETAAAAHVAVVLLNLATGNLGETLDIAESKALEALATGATLTDLQSASIRGDIEVLFVCEANPLFSLPGVGDWQRAFKAVPLVVALASTLDETAVAADLVLPLTTPIESWGDFVPYTGVNNLQQPAMRPLFGARQMGDLFIDLAGQVGGAVATAVPWRSFTDCLRDQWSTVWEESSTGATFEAFWSESLRTGGTRSEPARDPLSLAPEVLSGEWLPGLEVPEQAGLQLILAPSLHHYDGGSPNTPWLEEIPDTLSQVAWGPWVEVHPDTARGLEIREGDLLAVESANGIVHAPAHLNSWMRADSVTVPLGHRYPSRGESGLYTSAVHLLGGQTELASGGILWLGTTVSLRRLGPSHQLLSPRASADLEDRPIAPTVSVEALRRFDPAQPTHEAEDGLYGEHTHPDHRWGMVIDLHACTGCAACSVACYAENNVAVVGREQMALGREMAWLRLEVYESGTDSPEMSFLPMLCKQCDDAPCEPVCPVYATYHNPEGLNAQIYNRCVGTRYCSNNCPYKVRRFNWLQPEFPEPLNQQLNPSVTVRDAGVMEKCTFCVQRIQGAKFLASDEKRDMRDGDVVPACAQTCPADAITFGDLNDADSAVSRAADDPRSYAVLEHLNTKPAVRYLKKITTGRRS